ncbi:MAG TPA: AraC family transcriptional regulator [Chthoniobacterales bacterium]|jgi:AraC-like DNA-binding protein
MSSITTYPSVEFAGHEHDRALPANMWRARNYIQEHLEEHISLTSVARFAGISANHLSDKFKAVNGVNFVDYVARARFDRACGLLPDRHLRISEIAFEVGFQSLSQFNRVFKRLSGLSPTDYRVRHEDRRNGNGNGNSLSGRHERGANLDRKNA